MPCRLCLALPLYWPQHARSCPFLSGKQLILFFCNRSSLSFPFRERQALPLGLHPPSPLLLSSCRPWPLSSPLRSPIAIPNSKKIKKRGGGLREGRPREGRAKCAGRRDCAPDLSHVRSARAHSSARAQLWRKLRRVAARPRGRLHSRAFRGHCNAGSLAATGKVISDRSGTPVRGVDPSL